MRAYLMGLVGVGVVTDGEAVVLMFPQAKSDGQTRLVNNQERLLGNLLLTDAPEDHQCLLKFKNFKFKVEDSHLKASKENDSAKVLRTARKLLVMVTWGY